MKLDKIKNHNKTSNCKHPKRQREYYSGIAYKCWKCRKIVMEY